jgi:acyl transferase domain-containing protein
VECQPWTTNQHRLAGVSGFGFGGTNCHVILQEAAPRVEEVSKVERPLHLLTLSAKNERALMQLAQRYETYLAEHPDAVLADICFTSNTGRFHGEHRLAVIAECNQQLGASLRSFVAQQPCSGLVRGRVERKKRPKLAFLTSGEGCDSGDAGRELYETQPAYRHALDQGDGIESALASLWKSWGVQPDASGPDDLIVEMGPEQANWQSLLTTLGKLYVSGVPVDWLGFDQEYRRRQLVLPTYPFQRQRHWIDP